MDRRRHPRTTLAVDLVFAKDGAASVMAGRSKDISLGGMFIVTSSPTSYCTSVTIQLTLPAQTDSLVLPGVVRWVLRDGIGVQFSALGPRETHAILRYAASRGDT